MNDFKSVLKKMPLVLFDGFDPLDHKTIADLQFLAEHEINLHVEGDIVLSRQDITRIKKFIKLCDSKAGKK